MEAVKSDLERQFIERLASKNGTGKYIFQSQSFEENIDHINFWFNKITERFRLGYSIKANYHEGLFSSSGFDHVSFDCASLFELDKLLDAGINPDRIWVCTPCLAVELLSKCVELGITIHADSPEQLMQIQKEASEQGRKQNVGLRFNFLEMASSRFGIEDSEENIKKVKCLLSDSSNLELTTLHCHYSEQDRSADRIVKRATLLYDLYKNHFEDSTVSVLNIGGGFVGPMSLEQQGQFDYDVPDWESYASSLEPVLGELKNSPLTLTIEPGMALVAHCFSFLAEVISIKKSQKGESIATLNSSKIFLKPTNHSRSIPFEVFPQNHLKSSVEQRSYTLAGMTCMESDVLGKYEGVLEVGDLIVFKNVGGYTMSYRPNFIYSSPAVITV